MRAGQHVLGYCLLISLSVFTANSRIIVGNRIVGNQGYALLIFGNCPVIIFQVAVIDSNFIDYSYIVWKLT
jgi:hypothetical protein